MELTALVVLLGLHGRALVAGVAPVRSCQELLLCLLALVPTAFQMDPPLSQGEPGSGSASGVTLLTRGRKMPCVTEAQERSENVGEKQCCSH